tara:strand:+ start:3835 stop:4557 length:723 start_codon:yes stop_codon:yes gene_type:complete
MALYGKRKFKHVNELDGLMPQATRSYVPIAFSELTETVKRSCDEFFNSEVRSFDFTTDKTGNKQFGVFTYPDINNPQMDYMVGYRSSYDKSISAQFCGGGSVIVCDNMMFIGDVFTARKHTTNMMEDLEFKIDGMLDTIEISYGNLEKDIDRMKEIELNNTQVSKILGDLAFNKRLIGSSTANSSMRAWHKSIYDGSGYYDDKNMWRLYNAITENTRHANPLNSFKIKEVHKHLMENYAS